MIIAFIILLIIVVISMILGILFFKEKGACLIAGYNTAGPAKKPKYNIKSLCKFVGILMFIMSGCFGFSAVGALIENEHILMAGIYIWIAAVTIGVIYSNTGQRFRK